jgi:putative tryptophan/tyrosine transport system substrate-binding protein
MRRREFLAGLDAAAWPLTARAQQPKLPMVGVLTVETSSRAGLVALSTFREALAMLGWIEGRNVRIEVSTTTG